MDAAETKFVSMGLNECHDCPLGPEFDEFAPFRCRGTHLIPAARGHPTAHTVRSRPSQSIKWSARAINSGATTTEPSGPIKRWNGVNHQIHGANGCFHEPRTMRNHSRRRRIANAVIKVNAFIEPRSRAMCTEHHILDRHSPLLQHLRFHTTRGSIPWTTLRFSRAVSCSHGSRMVTGRRHSLAAGPHRGRPRCRRASGVQPSRRM